MKTEKSWLWKVGVSMFAFAMIGVAANAGVISAGNYDSFGVKAGNTLWGWGGDSGFANNYTDPARTQTIPIALSQLGLGPTNGMVKMNNVYVVVSPTQSGTAKKWLDVVGGENRGFGIQSDGTLWGWGYDGTPTDTELGWYYVHPFHSEQNGALGMGAQMCQVITQVHTTTVWTNFSGGAHNDDNMYVYTDTESYTNSVMNGLTTNRPTQVGTDTSWRQVAVGHDFGLGLQADGSIWSWGSDGESKASDVYNTNGFSIMRLSRAWGRLGQGDMLVTETNYSGGTITPRSMQHYTNDGVGNYTLVDTSVTTLTNSVWGTNFVQYVRALNTPTKITAPTSMVCVVAGEYHSVAVGSDGSLWTWGKNQGGGYAISVSVYNYPDPENHGYYYHELLPNCNTNLILGLGDSTLFAANVPTRVGSETTWASVSAGMNAEFTMAIKKDGSLWGWGNNGAQRSYGWNETWMNPYSDQNPTAINTYGFRSWAEGCLGLGSNVLVVTTPTRVGTDNNWTMVSAGNAHCLGLKSDGSLYAWGNNGSGRLGLGRGDAYVDVPTRIGADNDWVAVSAGRSHSLALKSDGSLWGWGNNACAALGDQEGNAYEPVKISDGWGYSAPVIAASENGGGDYDGDDCTDFVIYDASTGNWQVRLSLMGYTLLPLNAMLGGPGYRLVTGDFDGDGVTDPAVYQESSGTWKVMLSGSSYALETMVFGGSGFTAVPADYDGDFADDFAVYNKTTGDWYIRLSDSGINIMKNSVGAGCVPVPMDYDGDGEADLATYELATGKWQIELSRYDDVVAKFWFGDHNYLPVPMDYDGDGLADPAVYGEATGNWGIRLSKYDWMTYYSAVYGWTLGGTGYIATPADYDGDGLADMTAYSLTTGQWTIMLSRSAYYRVTTQW